MTISINSGEERGEMEHKMKGKPMMPNVEKAMKRKGQIEAMKKAMKKK